MKPIYRVQDSKWAKSLLWNTFNNQSPLKLGGLRVALESDSRGWVQRAVFFPDIPDPDISIVLDILPKTSVAGTVTVAHSVSCDCQIWRKVEGTIQRGSCQLSRACLLIAWDVATAQGIKMFMGEQGGGLNP